jgi:uncharacterized membrane protein
MLFLIAGLVLFLGTHALTMRRATRERLVARLGANGYRGLYSLVSIAGFALVVWGFGHYRETAWVQVWSPPKFTKHLALLLTLPIFVLFIAAYAPGRIKAKAKHPMLLAVKIWATVHLLANGDLGGMLLFAGFLAWGVAARVSLKRRAPGAPSPIDKLPSRPMNDVIAVVGGLVLWGLFVRVLHPMLIGVVVWPHH